MSALTCGLFVTKKIVCLECHCLSSCFSPPFLDLPVHVHLSRCHNHYPTPTLTNTSFSRSIMLLQPCCVHFDYLLFYYPSMIIEKIQSAACICQTEKGESLIVVKGSLTSCVVVVKFSLNFDVN